MSGIDTRTSTRQNADLTFKMNSRFGRHGWLRLTPAYSVKLVSEILAGADRGIRVLDPFSGTGTTPLCAAYAGDKGAGVEINPFLVWLGNAKLATYRASSIDAAREALCSIISRAGRRNNAMLTPPPMHNIERWWDTEPLRFLCGFKTALEDAAPTGSPIRDLLLIVFCRLLISLSNAAFNHQSMSFKDKVPARSLDKLQPLLFDVEPDLAYSARMEGEHVLNSAAENPRGAGVVVTGDSRSVSTTVHDTYDLIVTSPPYPNRMSYVRELRPYMYWLGYLKTGRDAGDMDWSAIGGTWGIATSRLATWQRSSDGFYPRYFDYILAKIRHADKKSGSILSNYVAKYFEDIWGHIKSARSVVTCGGAVHYIIGNSTFYDVLVPVERLFASMLTEAGFSNAHITRIRKRNSKKELYEFDVSATR